MQIQRQTYNYLILQQNFYFQPSTRFSSGVIVAHFMPTLHLLIASAASIVTMKINIVKLTLFILNCSVSSKLFLSLEVQ
jgi:hypothetical protein